MRCRFNESPVYRLNQQIVRWYIDMGLLVAFVVCVVTGILKFTSLMRMLGLTGLVFPLAFFSDLHDWSGIVLIVLVGVHLFVNRAWIVYVTKKIIAGSPVEKN